jgi:hypothetical protein
MQPGPQAGCSAPPDLGMQPVDAGVACHSDRAPFALETQYTNVLWSPLEPGFRMRVSLVGSNWLMPQFGARC